MRCIIAIAVNNSTRYIAYRAQASDNLVKILLSHLSAISGGDVAMLEVDSPAQVDVRGPPLCTSAVVVSVVKPPPVVRQSFLFLRPCQPFSDPERQGNVRSSVQQMPCNRCSPLDATAVRCATDVRVMSMLIPSFVFNGNGGNLTVVGGVS